MGETILDVIKATREANEKQAREAHEKAQPVKPYAFKAMGVDDHGVIIGIGAVAENTDLDKEILEQKGLVQMSYDFCGAKARVLKANHGDALDKAELVASWPGAPILKSGKILAAGEAVPADDPIVGINIEKGKETHWFVGIRPNDETVLKAAKDGGIAGFSWGAFVTKTPVSA